MLLAGECAGYRRAYLRDVNVGEVSAAEPCLGVEQSQQKIVVDSAGKQHNAKPAGGACRQGLGTLNASLLNEAGIS